MKVVNARACVFCQLVERGRFLRLLDQTAGLRDLFGILLCGGRLVGFASLARPEARFLGVFASQVIQHVLGPRQAGRTRWTAVNSRSLDRVIKFSIAGCVTLDDRHPARIILCRAGAFFDGGVLVIWKSFLFSSEVTLTSFALGGTPFFALKSPLRNCGFFL